jgi:hypothetical protein
VIGALEARPGDPTQARTRSLEPTVARVRARSVGLEWPTRTPHCQGPVRKADCSPRKGGQSPLLLLPWG